MTTSTSQKFATTFTEIDQHISTEEQPSWDTKDHIITRTFLVYNKKWMFISRKPRRVSTKNRTTRWEEITALDITDISPRLISKGKCFSYLDFDLIPERIHVLNLYHQRRIKATQLNSCGVIRFHNYITYVSESTLSRATLVEQEYILATGNTSSLHKYGEFSGTANARRNLPEIVVASSDSAYKI